MFYFVKFHKIAKDFARRRITRNDAVLHVHGGMIAWLLTALWVGDAGAVLPLLVACGVEVANELFDRLRTGTWRWNETIPDFGHSLVWPFLLFALARAGLI